MDYLGGPNVTTRVLKNRRGRQKSGSEKDATVKRGRRDLKCKKHMTYSCWLGGWRKGVVKKYRWSLESGNSSKERVTSITTIGLNSASNLK